VQIAKRDVGGRIVALDHERSWFDAQATTRVRIGSPRVRPIRDLIAVDPDRRVRAIDDQRFVEPLHVIRDDAPRVLSSENSTRAAIHRLRPITVFEPVMDLALVPVHLFARDAAKEDPGVEIRGVRDALKLQNEITVRFLRFQLATPVCNVQAAVLVHAEYTWHFRVRLPAGQIVTVEDRRKAEWLQRDVANSESPLRTLQPDVTARERMRVRVLDDALIISRDGDMALLDPDIQSGPRCLRLCSFGRLALDKAPGRVLRVSPADANFVTTRSRIMRVRGGRQQDTADSMRVALILKAQVAGTEGCR